MGKVTVMTALIEFCFDATKDIEVLDEARAAKIADWVVEQVIEALHKDSRAPKRSYYDWALTFADVRREIEDVLLDDLSGKANLNAVVEAIAQALAVRNHRRTQRRTSVGATS